MDTMQDTAAQRMAELLAARGYRRTSGKHCILSRIDRPDWVDVLARALRRSPAEFYEPGESTPSGRWCDSYRRCHSDDKITVSPVIAKLVPGSSFDATGYVPPFPRPSAARVLAFTDPLLTIAQRVLDAARGDDLEVFRVALMRLETQVQFTRGMLQ